MTHPEVVLYHTGMKTHDFYLALFVQVNVVKSKNPIGMSESICFQNFHHTTQRERWRVNDAILTLGVLVILRNLVSNFDMQKQQSEINLTPRDHFSKCSPFFGADTRHSSVTLTCNKVRYIELYW